MKKQQLRQKYKDKSNRDYHSDLTAYSEWLEDELIKATPKKQTNPIEEREQEFRESLRPFLQTYPRQMLISFFNYWSEKNRSGTKMRFELEKTWEVSRRLVTWANNDKSFNQTKHGNTKENERQSLREEAIRTLTGN